MGTSRQPRLKDRLEAVEGALSESLFHATRRKRRLPGLHGLVDQLERMETPWTAELRSKWLAAVEKVADYSMDFPDSRGAGFSSGPEPDAAADPGGSTTIGPTGEGDES